MLKVIASIILVMSFSVRTSAYEMPEPIHKMDVAVSDELKWEDKKLADTISDLTLVWSAYIAPVVVTLDEDNVGGRLATLTTAHLASIVLTKSTKYYFGRMRPDGSDSRSFFSGHASAAFTGAAYICKYEPKHCPASIIAAGATSYLRIAASKHWLTDVLVGSFVGYAVGSSVPIFIKGF